MSLPLTSALEAVLFAAGEPVKRTTLVGILDVSGGQLDSAIEELKGILSGRGLALIETKDEVELRTAPAAAGAVKKLREGELSRDLGKASLETLAIILYKKGATRGEIDWIRGVNSAAATRSLLLRGLIDKREDTADRRRVRYDITPEALAHLGIGKGDEAPRFEELSAALADRGEAPAAEAA